MRSVGPSLAFLGRSIRAQPTGGGRRVGLPQTGAIGCQAATWKVEIPICFRWGLGPVRYKRQAHEEAVLGTTEAPVFLRQVALCLAMEAAWRGHCHYPNPPFTIRPVPRKGSQVLAHVGSRVCTVLSPGRKVEVEGYEAVSQHIEIYLNCMLNSPAIETRCFKVPISPDDPDGIFQPAPMIVILKTPSR